MITCRLLSGPTPVLWGGLMDVFTLPKIIIVSKWLKTYHICVHEGMS